MLSREEVDPHMRIGTVVHFLARKVVAFPECQMHYGNFADTKLIHGVVNTAQRYINWRRRTVNWLITATYDLGGGSSMTCGSDISNIVLGEPPRARMVVAGGANAAVDTNAPYSPRPFPAADAAALPPHAEDVEAALAPPEPRHLLCKVVE